MAKSIWRITTDETGVRLDKWLAGAERLNSRSRALAALEKGQIFINEDEQSAGEAGRRLQPGETVRLWLDRPGSAARRNYAGTGKRIADLHLIYEDPILLVVNKPAGLLSVPLPAKPDEPSLLEKVATHLRGQGLNRAFIVHRIDRDTSGLVVFTKSFPAQQKLKHQFERHEPERIYHAFVYGQPQPDKGTWRDELVWDQEELKQKVASGPSNNSKEVEKQEAECRYRVLERYAEAALVEVSLITGKRNQIRIQAGLRGHPLIGERQYVYQHKPAVKIEFPRQALHALRLSFRHPQDGRKVKFEAQLPADLQTLQQRLRAVSKV
jgi:23S rRNA pseudouridine1911/1915/1917 synthase